MKIIFTFFFLVFLISFNPLFSQEASPYLEEEVSFTNGENIFSGTLSIPKAKGKYPAVVLITGSGAQNRDEEISGFKLFAQIADYFTKQGMAVLRYDDRGTGKTTGKTINESTTAEFAEDVQDAMKYLRTRADILPQKIGLLGHSEGGIVAPMVAADSKNEVAFIVLMAGTGVNGSEIIIEQSRAIMMAMPNPDTLKIKKELPILAEMHQVIVAEDSTAIAAYKKKTVAKILSDIEALPEEQKKFITNKEVYASSALNRQMAQFSVPWMKFFLGYDPAPTLEKVTCPVLLLFGELDLQVLPSQNQDPMVNALKKGGNKDYEVKIFPKANHLFQEAETGSPQEYGKLKKEFVPDFLEYTSDWIKTKVN
jgi:hypothetical protein